MRMLFRLSRVLLLIVVAFGIAGCKEALYTGLDERQANEMVAVLYAHGISASRTRDNDGLYSVDVDSSDLGAAIIFLDAADLPRDDFQTMGEVFPADGVVGTAFEEHVRFIYALSQELSQTVSEIEGVQSARVHIMIPERTRLQDTVEPSRASVAVYRTEDFDPRTSVPSIKTLVAYAVPGLSYENVAVAIFSAGGLERIDIEPVTPDGAAFASISLLGTSVGTGPVASEPVKIAIIATLTLLVLAFVMLQLMRGASSLMRALRGIFDRRA